MKTGVYVACAHNPMFLRLLLLQIEAQTRRPDYIAIHENGLEHSFYPWSCADVAARLTAAGTQILYKHTPNVVKKHVRYGEALQLLITRSDTELFIKQDIDDIFYSNQIETLVNAIGDMDWLVNKNCQCLLLRPKEVIYRDKVDFGKVNMLGGMSDNMIFRRNLALAYNEALMAVKDETADDVILFNLRPKFPNGKVIDGPVTCCYCSHGQNASSAIWQKWTPAVLK